MYDFIIVIAILLLILSYSLKNKISLGDTSIVIFILLLIYSIYNNLSYYYILICFVFIIVLHSNHYNNSINKVKNILSPYYKKYIGLGKNDNLNIEKDENYVDDDECVGDTYVDDCCINNYDEENINKSYDEYDYYDEMMENYNIEEQSEDEDIRSMFSFDTDNNIDNNINDNIDDNE